MRSWPTIELDLAFAAVVQEAACQFGRVGAHNHLVVSWIQGLVERLVQPDEVVLRRVWPVRA